MTSEVEEKTIFDKDSAKKVVNELKLRVEKVSVTKYVENDGRERAANRLRSPRRSFQAGIRILHLRSKKAFIYFNF